MSNLCVTKPFTNHKLSTLPRYGTLFKCRLIDFCFYRNCSDSLKSSLASALRHSQRQAQNTYDRRTLSEKKKQAVDYARDLAETDGSLQDVASTSTASTTRLKFKPGAFVAAVEEGSTLNKPKILIGRVLFYTKPGEEVLLLWYKQQKLNNIIGKGGWP